MTNIDTIAELQVGETYTKSQRLPDNATLKDMKKAGAKMTNTLRAAAHRASQRTGLDYHVERGSHITKSDNWMVSIFVTAYEKK